MADQAPNIELGQIRRNSFAASERDLHSIFDDSDRVNDGHTSYDDHSSDEDAPTQSRAGPPARSAHDTHLSSFKTNELVDSSIPIFFRHFGDQRAPRYRDIEAGSSIVPPASSQAPLSGHHGPEIFEIMHNWTQEKEDESLIPKINVVKRLAQETNQIRSLRDHVGWLHAEESRPSLEKLENLFKDYLTPRLATYISETTDSLLKRVRIMKERNYVGGKFLITGPIRYDGRLLEIDDDDHPCLFFSFPYFAVGDFHDDAITTAAKTPNQGASQGKRFGVHNSAKGLPKTKDNSIHPVRTLLQSRYRLESTKKRDENQSITTLGKRDVKDCINAPQDVARQKKGSKWKPVIHVPQLWGLSVSGDTMITSGPISESHLSSSALRKDVVTLQAPQSQSGPSIVRINLVLNGKKEIFVYPADRCEWYFGLLNKEHKILDNLGEEQRKSGIKYSLSIREDSTDTADLITSENWINLLRDGPSPEMDIWMYGSIPSIELQPDSGDESSDSGVDKSTRGGKESEPGINSPHRLDSGDLNGIPTATRTTSEILLKVPSHQRDRSRSSGHSSTTSQGTQRLIDWTPLLQWPFREDKDRNDDRMPDERVNVWLEKVQKAIARSHPNEFDLAPQSQNTGGIIPVPTTLKRSPITGSTREHVYGHLIAINTAISPTAAGQNGAQESRSSLEVNLVFTYARRLLKLFVPETFSVDELVGDTWSPAEREIVCLYWGLIDRLLTNIERRQLHAVELTQLLKGMSDTIGLAEILHRGVRKYKRREDDGLPHSSEVVNVGSAVVQTPIPVAFEHICHFLFDVVRYASGKPANRSEYDPVFKKAAGRNLHLVQKNLRMAKSYLIAAADESTLDKGLGPVVTPEAIILLLLERLSRGVYEDGSISVTEIYEKVVEKLASQVEKRPTRHLLLEINRVTEELEIIIEVYKQQEKFFEVYRGMLNHESFEFATINRKTRFRYEDIAIERINRAVKERINDCTELHHRTERLADQNVKLVETYQDDDNKTVLIFTVVTITFLPASFVTGFFGMNVRHINDTQYTVKHFWVIAAPLTFAVVILSLTLASLGRIRRKWAKVKKALRKRKMKRE